MKGAARQSGNHARKTTHRRSRISNDDPPKYGLSERPLRKADYDAAALAMVEHRYDRKPAEGGRVRALDELHAELSAHGALYRTDDLQDQRDAVAASLLAVQRYLQAQGFAPQTTEPIMRPVQSLVEREARNIDPLFAERSAGGRPRRSMADNERTGAIAAITEAWLASKDGQGLKMDLRLDRLARELSGPWFGQLRRAQIKSAREMVSQEAKDHPAVSWAAYFRQQLSEAAHLFGPAAATDVVVNSLKAQALRSAFAANKLENP